MKFPKLQRIARSILDYLSIALHARKGERCPRAEAAGYYKK